MMRSDYLASTSSGASMIEGRSSNGYLDCRGSPSCGVLTLESGFGSGKYHHELPSVHGLWPEVGSYGNAPCLKPVDPAALDHLSGCYDDLSFQTHEWDKHGKCAGVDNAEDYFDQVCGLASKPLNVMVAAGETWEDMLQAMMEQFPVWNVDESQKQVEITACAGEDRIWRIASEDEFSSVCGMGEFSENGVVTTIPEKRKSAVDTQHRLRGISSKGDVVG